MAKEFDARLQYEVDFLREHFRAESKEEQAIFDYTMMRLDNGTPISAVEKSLAKIGGPEMLHYLYDKNTYDVDDYSVRLSIVRNPRCDELLLSRALRDRDWEVRKAAVLNERTPIHGCFERAQKEGNPYVIDALKERLGDRFPERRGPQPVAAARAMAMRAPEATGVVQDVLANAFARSAETGRAAGRKKEEYSLG